MVSTCSLLLPCTVAMKDLFYNRGRLIQTFASEIWNRVVASNHSMITAFTDSVNKVMIDPGNEGGTV